MLPDIRLNQGSLAHYNGLVTLVIEFSNRVLHSVQEYAKPAGIGKRMELFFPTHQDLEKVPWP
jgi:hypothetical protein